MEYVKNFHEPDHLDELVVSSLNFILEEECCVEDIRAPTDEPRGLFADDVWKDNFGQIFTHNNVDSGLGVYFSIGNVSEAFSSHSSSFWVAGEESDDESWVDDKEDNGSLSVPEISPWKVQSKAEASPANKEVGKELVVYTSPALLLKRACQGRTSPVRLILDEKFSSVD